jgi:hypothetical protein
MIKIEKGSYTMPLFMVYPKNDPIKWNTNIFYEVESGKLVSQPATAITFAHNLYLGRSINCWKSLTEVCNSENILHIHFLYDVHFIHSRNDWKGLTKEDKRGIGLQHDFKYGIP